MTRTSRRVSVTAEDLTGPGVTYTRTEAPPFFATAYEVRKDGRLLGTVASQRDGRSTYWGHAVGDAPMRGAFAPSRPVAVVNLLSEATA